MGKLLLSMDTGSPCAVLRAALCLPILWRGAGLAMSRGAGPHAVSVVGDCCGARTKTHKGHVDLTAVFCSMSFNTIVLLRDVTDQSSRLLYSNSDS